MLPLCECGFHGVGKVGNLFSGMITDTLFFLSWHSEFSSHPPLSSTTFSPPPSLSPFYRSSS
jgi:hypothetical protein